MTTETPILFHNTMKITEGHLDAFQDAVRRAVEFVEQHAPQLMVQIFVDERNMRAHSFQLYADSASVQEHWQLSDPYIRAVMEHCTVERFEVYGEPDPVVLEALPSPNSEDRLRLATHSTGFIRSGVPH